MIKTIVFDIGGVCLTEVDWAMIIGDKYNLPINDVRELIQENYKKCASSSEKCKTFWIGLKEKYNINDTWENIRASLINSILLMQETVNLIRKLRKNGYEMLFFSNSHIDLTPEIVEKYNLMKEFDNGLFSHEYPFFKPDKKFYEKLLTITISKPDEIVYIEDKENNLNIAKELDMHIILFKTVEHLIEDLRKLSVRI